MTLEYAKAYSNERLAHAQLKRQQRQAARSTGRFPESRSHQIRSAVGERLITAGEWLAGRSSVRPAQGRI